MNHIKWDQSFEIGHERIDLEHRVFFNLLESLDKAFEANKPTALILRLLTEIEKYAEFHFYSEETIMLECGYPELERQQQQHHALLQELADKIDEFKTDRCSGFFLPGFLFEWLVLHTSREDRKLSRFIPVEKPKLGR